MAATPVVLSSYPPSLPLRKMPDGMEPNLGEDVVDVSGNIALKL
jgi:hypothetical protein